MENFKKSWQTTALGAIIIGIYVYKMVILKEPIDVEQMVGIITGAAIAMSKYQGASHTKK